MSTYNVSYEYMHCFNAMDEISESDPMEIETGQPGVSKKVAEPDIKKLMDLSSYEGFLRNISMSTGILEAHANEKEDSSSKLLPVKASTEKI
ncbi:uncharacterized protein BX663DRAFT_561091 [Cokeromyces recurvatus]|uniref:uncharacterized protein n=1 Tax=Cokeromyces recurvatus TaxID=90255 RepID=UPI00221F19FE|nr:uncharacterized protein BX663DRAFT_561091 [Cokeromyces recurvatus]KAI7903023.1 hypothetical protein BX663DRAFT_561091 [Cokeromyces recurvatus]